MTSPSQNATGSVQGRRGYRAWLRLGRLPVLLVATLVAMAVMQELTVVLSGVPLLDLVVGVAAGAATLWGYARLSRYVEQRAVITELPRERARSGLVWGSVIGGGAFVFTMLLILIFGGWQVSGGEPGKLLGTLGVMATAAVTEEIVFRGVIFRIAEQRLGSWLALALSAVLFGLLHLAGSSQVSGGAELWGAVAIVLQGGLLLGVAYLATRSLWLPIGVHFAWNFVEAAFGTAVSGKTSEFGSLMHTTLLGPTALNGGSFGPEAGWAAILSCLIASVLMLRHAKRHGRIVRRSETAQLRAAQN